jgi:ADP-ribose pyrophosphatase
MTGSGRSAGECSRMSALPQIVSRQVLVENPWMQLWRKDVRLNGTVEDYYSLGLPDYVAIVARTPSGRLPLVRQYRPAVEQYTLELPAGTVNPGESAQDCCLRELREEVGLPARSVRNLGSYLTDTGRLGNRQHVFLVETEETPGPEFQAEPGLEIQYVTARELQELVNQQKVSHLLHLSALYLAGILPA